jgi:hypothetical protein
LVLRCHNGVSVSATTQPQFHIAQPQSHIHAGATQRSLLLDACDANTF